MKDYSYNIKGTKNTVYDSSLLSDSIMANNLYRRGVFPEVEYNLYLNLAKEMQANVSGYPFNGYPDLIVYLGGSFKTMINQIKSRGRDMEITDPKLVDYYRSVYDIYDNWSKSYSKTNMITVNMDNTDFVNDYNSRNTVLDKIESELVKINLLTLDEYKKLKSKRESNKLKIV